MFRVSFVALACLATLTVTQQVIQQNDISEYVDDIFDCYDIDASQCLNRNETISMLDSIANGRACPNRRIKKWAIQEKVASSVNWIDIYGNIIFHFNPRPNVRQIVMNTFHNNNWGPEERISYPEGALLIKAEVHVNDYGYMIFLGGQQVHFYKHRLPWTSFSYVQFSPQNYDVTLIH